MKSVAIQLNADSPRVLHFFFPSSSSVDLTFNANDVNWQTC